MHEPDPNILVDLTTCGSAFEAEVVRNALDQSGIPAFAATTAGAMNPWEVASSMPLRVQVRRCDLAAANAELETIHREAASIDWSTQDVGEPEEGDLAAAEPGNADWNQQHAKKVVVANLFLRLAYMVKFGPIGIGSVLIGLIAGRRAGK